MRVSADANSAQVKCLTDFGEKLLERNGIVDYNVHKREYLVSFRQLLPDRDREGKCGGVEEFS